MGTLDLIAVKLFEGIKNEMQRKSEKNSIDHIIFRHC